MSATETWSSALDELEALLRRQQEVALGMRADVPGGEFQPPDGTLPMELADRARALLARCREVQAVAARQLAANPRPSNHVYGNTQNGRFGAL